MDQLTVLEKIESLRSCIRRIEGKRADSADELRADVDRQDILSLNITRAIQLCADIAGHWLSGSDFAAPQSVGETFDRIAQAGVIELGLAQRLRKAVGFRNLAVHQYRAIDWDIVHNISRTRLEDFKNFAEAIMRRLAASDHSERAP